MIYQPTLVRHPGDYAVLATLGPYRSPHDHVTTEWIKNYYEFIMENKQEYQEHYHADMRDIHYILILIFAALGSSAALESSCNLFQVFTQIMFRTDLYTGLKIFLKDFYLKEANACILKVFNYETFRPTWENFEKVLPILMDTELFSTKHAENICLLKLEHIISLLSRELENCTGEINKFLCVFCSRGQEVPEIDTNSPNLNFTLLITQLLRKNKLNLPPNVLESRLPTPESRFYNSKTCEILDDAGCLTEETLDIALQCNEPKSSQNLAELIRVLCGRRSLVKFPFVSMGVDKPSVPTKVEKTLELLWQIIPLSEEGVPEKLFTVLEKYKFSLDTLDSLLSLTLAEVGENEPGLLDHFTLDSYLNNNVPTTESDFDDFKVHYSCLKNIRDLCRDELSQLLPAIHVISEQQKHELINNHILPALSEAQKSFIKDNEIELESLLEPELKQLSPLSATSASAKKTPQKMQQNMGRPHGLFHNNPEIQQKDESRRQPATCELN